MRVVIIMALLAASVLARPAEDTHWGLPQTRDHRVPNIPPVKETAPQRLIEPKIFVQEKPLPRTKLLLKVPNDAGQDWYDRFNEYEFDLFLDDKAIL